MKKLLAILILATLTVAGIAADRTLLIRTGSNILGQPGFNASDSIVTSSTYIIYITNIQKYQQHQVFTFSLTDVDGGSPSVAVTAYGRVSSNGSWVQIGDPVTWTTTGNNPSTISSAAPVNYNYLKVAFVASGATQHLKILTFDCRTSNAFEVPTSAGTVTFSRPTSGTVTVQVADDNANAAAVYRAGGTGALTLGASTGTTAITSSDWAIGATGAMTGIGAITADGLITGTAGATLSGAAVNLNASSNYAVNLGTGTTTSTVTLGGNANNTSVLSPLNVVADGDSIILNPYKRSKPFDVRMNGATKFFVDSLGNAVAQGNIVSATAVVAIDTCLGVQTKNVASVGVLRVTAASTLNGLAGGVAGQLLRILNTSATTLVLKHNGSGTQKFMLSGAGDMTMTGQYNAVTLTFDGTYWFVTGKGQ